MPCVSNKTSSLRTWRVIYILQVKGSPNCPGRFLNLGSCPQQCIGFDIDIGIDIDARNFWAERACE